MVDARPRVSGGAWIFIALAVVCMIAGGVYFTFWFHHEHGIADSYVGAKECARCHEKQAASWAQTRMARSFEALRPGQRVEEKKLAGLDPKADYTHDKKCLACHTTGYGRVGGFTSMEQTPDLAGVTCEACHGPGGRYVGTVMEQDEQFKLSDARAAGLIYPPTAQMCIRCHNEDSPFARLKVTYDRDKSVQQGTHEHYQLKYEHGQ